MFTMFFFCVVLTRGPLYLDRIKHDAYKIHILPADPANYRSMREVYGLDKSLSE